MCVCVLAFMALHLAEQVTQINIDIKHSEAFIILVLSATKAVAEMRQNPVQQTIYMRLV